MSIVAFVSAVSDEFHHRDPCQPWSFESYREVLARSLRILVKGCRVTTQEDLVQGPGDLLETLEEEIRVSHLVIHLVGSMAGAIPELAAVRRLRERNREWLAHEPELAAAVGDGKGISYTQWEAYLAFQHRRGRLVFVVDDRAPRSPWSRRDENERTSQQRHFKRLQQTGEHYEACLDQLDLARKAVASIERFGLRPDAPALNEKALAAARQDAAGISMAIGTSLRSLAKTASVEFDPPGIGAFLQAIDTAAFQWELDRRSALQAVHEHREELRARVAVDPAPENLYELALGELALANYLEAMQVAERLAEQHLSLMQSDPARAESHRERAQNAFLLLHEAAQLATRRDDAIAALERAGSLVDINREPVLWAELHEPLAQFLLDHALYDRAEPIIDRIIDIREEHQEEGDSALPNCLILWCSLLKSRARFGDVASVAARAVRLFSQQSPPSSAALASALSWQAGALESLGRFAEAEPLMRRALAIDQQVYGDDHPEVAGSLSNLAAFLHDTKQVEEAEALMRRALAMGQQSYGDDHPKVALRLNNLAQLLHSTNRLAEAEPFMRRALAIDEQTYGPEHPEVSICLNNLAGLLRVTNRRAEAELLVRRALAIDEKSFGDKHPEVALRLNSLAMLLKETNRLEEAGPLMRRALAIDEQSYGAEHPRVAMANTNLAMLLKEANRLAEAEPLVCRALAIFAEFKRKSGYEHPWYAGCLKSYRSLLDKLGIPPDEINRRLRESCGEAESAVRSPRRD